MVRLPRFEEYRFIGARDSMIVYDSDDPSQRAELGRRVDRDDLYQRNLLQTFAPDSLSEAANRGFGSAQRS